MTNRPLFSFSKSNRFWTLFFCVLSILALSNGSSVGQNLTTGNQYVVGNVQPADGKICVLIAPGRLGIDGQLDFYDKSFLSVSINGQIFSNNDIIAGGNRPPNFKLLNNGTSVKIADTIRTTWLDKAGCDIIQDVYPIAFEKSGQIIMRWSVKNKVNTPAGVAVQWLNDVQISDPTDKTKHGSQTNATDGPKILHRYGYRLKWEQMPNAANAAPTIPWFYIAFLWQLPDLNPGLSGQAYLDFPPIINKKPSRMTVGDWYTMAQTAFGANPAWPLGTALTTDDAVLLEWPPASIGANQQNVIGITSYGTGEFDICNGNIFGIMLYPHRIFYIKDSLKYIPNPFHLEFYAFDPSSTQSASNSRFTLTAGPNLNIVDTPPKYNFIGKSQTIPTPPAPGTFIGPGGVAVFDWYLKVDPVYFCKGDFHSSLKITGTTGLGLPTFVRPTDGADTCEHDIVIECAETDIDPPLYTNRIDSVNDGLFFDTIKVHDDRLTDKGLKSITWTPVTGTDPSKFVITILDLPIKACYNDKDVHRVLVQQLDSTISGCFDFTFEDCLGNKSFDAICMLPHPKYVVPDTLKPVYTILQSSGSYDSSLCNTRFDSLIVRDDRPYDKGLDSIYVIPGTQVNMTFTNTTFQSGRPLKRFAITVQDSMLDGAICIRSVDVAKNYSDTCFHYCTIPDKLAPLVSIFADASTLGLWHVVVKDDAAWDRGIDQIFVSNNNNITFTPNGATPPTQAQTKRQREYYFDIQIIDSSKTTSFCVKANDLAGNMSDSICIYRGVGSDIYPPNIGFTPDPKTNPTLIVVDVNDVHFNDPPTNLDTVIWDTGLDSVWFTNNTGIITPGTIHYNCATRTKFANVFPLHVADSLLADSVACVTINAADCHGNVWARDWCYPYKPDSQPPIIVAKYIDKQQIQFTITDSTTYDRGVQTIGTTNELNLSSYNIPADRKPITSFVLQRPKIDQSSSGTVSAIDYWGTLLVGRLAQHTASVNFNVWVQDLAMKKGKQIRAAQNFDIPVYFVWNDTTSVLKKQITDFKFSFTMRGDISAVNFLGVSSVGTATATGWNVTATPSGATVLIEGHKQAGAPFLSARTPLDSLVILQFSALKDESTKNVVLDIDNVAGETVVYNNGKDTMYLGLSATAQMPPPWGSLSGSNIVIVGTCAPSLTSNGLAQKIVTLDEPTPNPISKQTTLHYTVSEESRVQISVFDMLGREVRHLLDQTQKQGYYGISLDVSDLPNGQYNVRLESNGTVVSKLVSVQK